MKKIFTLLVCALVAGSAAFALPVRKMEGLKVTKQLPDHAKMQAPNTVVGVTPIIEDNGIRRITNITTQQEWSMMVRLLGEAPTLLGLGFREDDGTITPATMEDFPYHVTLFATQYQQSTLVASYLLWPCKAAITESVITSSGDIDWTKAAQLFGSVENAQQAADIEDVLEYTGGTFPQLDGLYTYPCIIPMDGVVTWNGTEDLNPKPCTITNQGISKDGSYITWKSWDPDFFEAEFEYYMILGEADGNGGIVSGAKTTTANFVLKGGPTVLGFVDHVIDLGETHIFNCGKTDIDSAYGLAYYEKFEPVDRYYFLTTDTTMGFVGYNDKQETVYAWNYYGELQDVIPFSSSSGTSTYTWFKGALYTNVGDKLEGKWTMPEPDFKEEYKDNAYVITEWKSTPTAHELIPYYEIACAEQDGFQGVFAQYGADPAANLTHLGYGDKNVGFNFKYSVDGWCGKSISASTSSPIYMHNDINNWDEYTEVPSVGTADANVLNVDLSGVEEVFESNAPVVATQYFNLQGQRLSAAPEKGIFIQRSIKADGSAKAVKVAK